MFSRIAFFFITAFWLTMTFLLWRSEFGGRYVGSAVPVEVVWRKILTAPDPSSLMIMHHGKNIGNCQWSADMGQEAAAGKILTEGPAAESAHKPAGYRLEFAGNLALAQGPNRMGFNINGRFGTNHTWQEFDARFTMRPDSWEVYSKAKEQVLHFRTDTEGEKVDRVYKFTDFQNPQFLLREFELPVSLQLFTALGLPTAQTGNKLSLGLNWEARNDRITIGHATVRTYRLEAHLFDRLRIVIMVSPVGEILRVELPDEWVLMNDPLSTL